MHRFIFIVVSSSYLIRILALPSPESRHLSTTTSCGYKCSTCDSATPSICLSCNPSANRQLSGTDCVCNVQYFDAGQPSCFACSSNCLTCTSTASCTTCNTGYYNYNGNCLVSCPSDTFTISASFLCRDYLNFTISQKRDEENRIILNYNFNYDLNPVASSVTQISMSIVEDSTGSNVNILHLSSGTSTSQLSYLIVPRTSIAAVTVQINSFDTVNLVSLTELVPLSSSVSSQTYKIAIPPYLVPYDQSALSNLKTSSNFLFDEGTVSYTILEIIRALALFTHIVPCLQFILGITLMQCFKTPLFHYFLKLLAGFGQSRIPDWEMIDSQGDSFGMHYYFLFYYALQLFIFSALFGISKMFYQRSKQSDIINQRSFANIVRIHCFLVDAFQHTTETLLFYLSYYSIYVIKQLDFSSGINIAYFFLAILLLIFIFSFHGLGTYRIFKDCYHFFYVFVKDLNEVKKYSKYYLILVTTLKKVIFSILICAFFSVNSLAFLLPIIIFYIFELVFVILIRPFTNSIDLILKIIELLSQSLLFLTILSGQLIYNANKDDIVLNSTPFDIIDITCLVIFSMFLLVSLVKMTLNFRELLSPPISVSKRSLTFVQFQNGCLPIQPFGKGRNQALIDKTNAVFQSIQMIIPSQQVEMVGNLEQPQRKIGQDKFQKQLPIIMAENNVLKRLQIAASEEKDKAAKKNSNNNNSFNVQMKNPFQGLSIPMDGKPHMWNKYSNSKEGPITIGMLIEQKKTKENSDMILNYLSQHHPIEQQNKANISVNNNGYASSNNNNNNGAYSSIEKPQFQSIEPLKNNSNQIAPQSSINQLQLPQNQGQSVGTNKMNPLIAPEQNLDPSSQRRSLETLPIIENPFIIKAPQMQSNLKKPTNLHDIIEEETEQHGVVVSSSRLNVENSTKYGGQAIGSILYGKSIEPNSDPIVLSGNKNKDHNYDSEDLENINQTSKDRILDSAINLVEQKQQENQDEGGDGDDDQSREIDPKIAQELKESIQKQIVSKTLQNQVNKSSQQM